MIVSAISCPHCQKPDHIYKHGTTKYGTKRARCITCKKTFAINPKSNKITPEKEALILRHLEESTSIRGVCRVAQCTCGTVYKILKKNRLAPSP
jgi:transposase